MAARKHSTQSPNTHTFHFDNLEVRTVVREGEPWFVAADVSTCLSIRDAYNAVRGLDGDEKATHIMSTPGGTQCMTIINESGLYTLIMTSRKPEAQRFRKWVTSEVLPAIRKTGKYETAPVQQVPQSFPGHSTPFLFEGHQVRTVVKDSEPWFVAKDVAEVLGYSNPQKAIRDHCKGVNETVTPSAGGPQTVNIIPEMDVYRLIIRSKLPAAQRFEEWVVGEVLPTIRKTGRYDGGGFQVPQSMQH